MAIFVSCIILHVVIKIYKWFYGTRVHISGTIMSNSHSWKISNNIFSNALGGGGKNAKWWIDYRVQWMRCLLKRLRPTWHHAKVFAKPNLKTFCRAQKCPELTNEAGWRLLILLKINLNDHLWAWARDKKNIRAGSSELIFTRPQAPKQGWFCNEKNSSLSDVKKTLVAQIYFITRCDSLS